MASDASPEREVRQLLNTCQNTSLVTVEGDR